MTNLELILSISIFVSIGINVILFAYTRSVITRLLTLADELYDLREMSNSLSNHLESVYSLEMFYGDETLGSLMEHARSYVEQLETFDEMYALIEEDKTENDNTEDKTEAEEA
tara:strand:+ start:6461 stop:6799 length:339 start_codon:yes stop_codon:yes gene_type:complete